MAKTTTQSRPVVARKVATPRPARKPATKVAVTKSVAKPVARKAAVKKAVTVRVPKVPAKAVSTVVPKPAAAKPLKKPVSPKKMKLVRDSFSFPAHEHALLGEMKKRALKLGKEFKKSEILRAGMAHLSSLADTALVAVLSKVERVKTGRPSKKNKKK